MIQVSREQLRDLVRSLADIGIEPGPDVHERATRSLLQFASIHLAESRLDESAELPLVAAAHVNIAQRYIDAADLLRQSQAE